MFRLGTSERKALGQIADFVKNEVARVISGSQEAAHLGMPQLPLLTMPSSSRPQMSWGVQGQPVAMRMGNTEFEALLVAGQATRRVLVGVPGPGPALREPQVVCTCIKI